MKKAKFQEQIRRALLFYGVLPVIIISILFTIVTYFVWIRSIGEGNKVKCIEVGEKIENLIIYYEDFLLDLDREIDVKKIKENSDYKLEIVEEIYEVLNNCELRANVYLLDKDQNIVYSSNEKSSAFISDAENTWDFITKLDKSADIEVELKMYPNYRIKQSKLIIAKRVIREKETTGYIVFDIPEESLYNIIARYDNAIILSNSLDRVFITSDIRFSDKMNKIKWNYFNKKDYLISSYLVSKSNIIVYSVASIKIVDRTIMILLIANAFILIVMLGTMTLLSYKIAASKTVIIDQIVNAFTRVQEGDLDSSLDIRTGDEFEVIATTYNSMLTSIKELMKNNEKQIRENIYFQIRELESQFNPHFLFNTLEVIKYSIKIDTTKATKMIVVLSKILRYSVDYSISEVKLAYDIDYLENYLFIVKMRFGKRFSYYVEVADETKECKVPKLIFQPIIENTVKYGFGDHYLMEVRVKVMIQDNDLLIVFYDDGVGINKHKLDEIRSNLKSDKNQTEHLGIYNIHRRIVLLYGHDYGVNIDSCEGAGTVVKIKLPVKY